MRTGCRVWSALIVCSFGVVACGDDEKGAPSAQGEGADAAAPASCVGDLDPVPEAEVPAGMPEYTCNGMPSSSMPDSPNACRNQSDCDVIASDKVREISRVCGLSCRSYTDCDELEACNRKCVVDTTKNQVMAPGLTDGCADCYAGIAGCALEKCLTECAANADAPDCVKCSFTSGCRLAFEACSGLDRK